MSRKFHVTIEPISDDDIAALGMLAEHVSDYVSQNGNGQCATLCQIKFHPGGPPTLNGRLYTGDAMKYLDKHISVATTIQDAEESSDEDKQEP